ELRGGFGSAKAASEGGLCAGGPGDELCHGSTNDVGAENWALTVQGRGARDEGRGTSRPSSLAPRPSPFTNMPTPHLEDLIGPNGETREWLILASIRAGGYPHVAARA